MAAQADLRLFLSTLRRKHRFYLLAKISFKAENIKLMQNVITWSAKVLEGLLFMYVRQRGAVDYFGVNY